MAKYCTALLDLTLLVDAEAGDDEVKVLLDIVAVIDATLEIHGDDGDDEITARLRVGVQGDDGDDGDDALELAVFGADSIADLFLLLDGGLDLDEGSATANVEVLNIEDFAPIG